MENSVTYGVKGSRKVKQKEAGGLHTGYCCNEVIM